MYVTFDLWHVPRRAAARAAARMALDRPRLRRASGLTFSRLLGTGTGRRFTPLDADPSRWALLSVWDTPAAARNFERSTTIRAWARLADERWRVDLRPVAARGRWSGHAPFGVPADVDARHPIADDHGRAPVVAITRARLTPRRAVAFWHAVPPVAAELRGADGLLFTTGIGEAPIGYQGTFSMWRDGHALRAFAYQGQAHAAVVRRTPRERWYAEELFARFVVLGSHGTVRGVDPCEARRPTAVHTDDRRRIRDGQQAGGRQRTEGSGTADAGVAGAQ
ncbi:spheroidene monooxygenase [Frankia sp. EI5c]|uniref:spheroidene monooxygenase n=1 Tax=Frankia sp. EI5c TaxID=683316 RepID=UPI0007C35096|nr:spheroidene monooxygenase [Frankia sp. EI5c]OAA28672.1 spheroidene monooxygenase [Frankia sp. EI5c]